jgi:hypothetical protein
VVSVSEPERQSRLMAFVRQGGVAFAAGLLLAIAIVFLLELIRRPADAGADADATGLDGYPVVGHLPYSKAVESTAENLLADAALARAGRKLLTNLSAHLGGRVRGVVVVTSPPGSHGKTLVSTVLATLLSHINNNVLLVGTHFAYAGASDSDDGDRRDMVPSRWTFSENAPNNWVRSLWALDRSLWALPAWGDDNGGRLAPARLRRLLTEARGVFDVIVVDTPSNVEPQTLDIITWGADGVLEVISNANGATSVRRSAQEHLQHISAPFVGLVVNRVKNRPALLDSSARRLPSDPDPLR